jgi:hypothetical protein
VTRLKWMLVSSRLEIVQILTHPMELLGDMGMWNLILVCLEIMLVSVQDKCTVCTKCTIGLEIVLDTLDGIPR